MLRSNDGRNKVEQPSKGTFSRLEASSQTLTKNSSIEKHSVLHMDHPWTISMSHTIDYFDRLPCNGPQMRKYNR